jgi:hypothetical protein
MDAIKITDADRGGPEISGNVFEFVKDLHCEIRFNPCGETN